MKIQEIVVEADMRFSFESSYRRVTEGRSCLVLNFVINFKLSEKCLLPVSPAQSLPPLPYPPS